MGLLVARANSQAVARRTMDMLLRAAREAGWQRVKGEIKPDGSLSIDAGMADGDAGADFLAQDLRMGK